MSTLTWPLAWQNPDTWTQDITLPARTDKKVDDALAALWYAMDCPPSLADAIAEYVKRPYPWQLEWVKKMETS